MKKLLKLWIVLLCLTLWTVSAPETADLDLSQGSISFAADGDSVTATQNGLEIVAQSFRIVQTGEKTANSITVDRGSVALTLDNLNVESSAPALSVNSGASAAVSLEGTNALWSVNSAGIRVPVGAELSLDGTGSLVAVGRNHSAGIGGGFREDGGSIAIHGGTVTGTGMGAGIGGGTGCGATVTITGGTVTANGGNGGGPSAGIGNGYGGTRVTITGGTVTARGGSPASGYGGGAGIGNCNYGSGAVITITGGTVYARGGYGGGAGIGAGDHGGGATVTISNAEVTAIGGGTSAGIGGGGSTAYDTYGGSVQITDSVVTVTGYYSAIGSASSQNIHGCDSIIIQNSQMTAAFTDPSGIAYNEKLTDPVVLAPQQVSVAAGSETRLQASATAPGGFTCQWQHSANGVDGWTDLAGQNEKISSFSVAAENSGHWYRGCITNAYGAQTVTPAVQVYTLAYTREPEGACAPVGTQVTLQAASENPGISWYWVCSTDAGENYTTVPDSQNSSLTVTITDEAFDADYRCVITGLGDGVLISRSARVRAASEDCYYLEVMYQQELSGGYTAVSRQRIPAQAGSVVTASSPSYPGFTENDRRGVDTGTVREDCSLILTRYFDRDLVHLTFESFGDTNPQDIWALYGAPVTLPQLQAEGYVFDGWSKDFAGEDAVSFTTMPPQSMQLYARWLPDDSCRDAEYSIDGMLLLPDGLVYAGMTMDELLLLPEVLAYTAQIPEGAIDARLYVENLSSRCSDTAVLALYDSQGRLLERIWQPFRIQPGQIGEVTFSVVNTGGEAVLAKAFILSSGASGRPMCQQAVYGETMKSAAVALLSESD